MAANPAHSTQRIHQPQPPSAALPALAGRDPAGLDFQRTPFIAIWEVTRACGLVCRHCRAEAQPHRHPLELTTEEGKRLVIDPLAEMGTPVLVLTGGDPARRPDLAELVRYGVSRGLKVSLSPSATPLVTLEWLEQMREAGASRIAISLDGASAATHDAFRGIEGTFDLTCRVVEDIRRAGLTLQIGTTVTRHDLGELPAIARQVADWGAVLWSVFLLVPTGRGQTGDMVTAEEIEEVLQWLAELAERAPFDIKTTEGYHYRRVQIQREVQRRRQAGACAGSGTGEGDDAVVGGARDEAPGAIGGPRPTGGAGSAGGPPDGIRRAKGRVNAAKGFCFISHLGEVSPSGFLPLSAGSVRRTPLPQIYRDSELFRRLRNPELRKGKCGACEFRAVCGGSRSRAYALTGDPLESDPSCSYIPRRWAQAAADPA